MVGRFSNIVKFEGLRITGLTSEHVTAAKALLRVNELPFDDCDQHIENFIGVFERQSLIGLGGIEVHGNRGLLRSIAIVETARGRGLGSAIVDYLHEQARSIGLRYLYLLTETAETYFLAKGYECQARDDLPAEIKSTEQFQSLCPASAQAMRFRL